MIDLAPDDRVPGHRDPVIDPPSGRRRSSSTTACASSRPRRRSSRRPAARYELSQQLWGRELPPIQRRFAVAETLSHLERLVLEGDAKRVGDDRLVLYTSA